MAQTFYTDQPKLDLLALPLYTVPYNFISIEAVYSVELTARKS